MDKKRTFSAFSEITKNMKNMKNIKNMKNENDVQPYKKLCGEQCQQSNAENNIPHIVKI